MLTSLMKQVLKFHGELVVPRDLSLDVRSQIDARDSSLTVLRLLPLACALEDTFSLAERAQLVMESAPSEEFLQFRYAAALGWPEKTFIERWRTHSVEFSVECVHIL